MDNHRESQHFSELLLKFRDNSIDEEQLRQLEAELRDNPDARRYYVESAIIHSLFQGRKATGIDNFNASEPIEWDRSFWSELAAYEKMAPVINPPKEERRREPLQRVIYPPREKRKLSKFSIFTLVNAAAIFLFILILKYAPINQGVEVATLTDSLNAKWADNTGPIDKGARLTTCCDKLFLRQGMVEISFDTKVNVVIEGPAEFELPSDERIDLKYGRIYATVPPQAIGFTVNTPTARVIDLGTEFGVSAEISGDTSLYVMRGKTALVSGQEAAKGSIEVLAGMAKKVSGITRDVSDITFQEELFVRDIDSEYNIVWRQRRTLDLADMVSNGNGLGTGDSDIRLDYLKGFTHDKRGGQTLIAEDYLRIKNHPFIDGIFIPNQNMVVNSRGDVFKDFTETSGVHCSDLLANPTPGLFWVDGVQHTIRFDGQEYSDQGKSCIVMNGSNHGITFDLDAVRNHYGSQIKSFQARVGLADLRDKPCDANFYVLVDGQLRYSLLAYKEKGVLNDVLVELKDSNRFLTLATTENVNQIDYMANSTLRENFCVFTEPSLNLE